MLTEFARDHAFTVAWFGLMTVVWFGWAQEDPPRSWRWKLGVGSTLGAVLAALFGFAVSLRWSDGSALDGSYHWFGVLVGVEVLAAGVGCLVLALRGQSRWMCWWVAVVVALHFLPLSVLLADFSIAVVGLVQCGAIVALIPSLRRTDIPTSRYVGPTMGAVLLLFAVVSASMFITTIGLPWAH